MAFLTDIPTDITPAVKRSPFWAKTYGGYTREQLDFFLKNLGTVDGKRICDPMSGQAFSTCQMAWSGADVQLFDIMVGPLALASLRDPVVLQNATAFASDIFRTLRRLRPSRQRKIVREHFPDWVSPQIAHELQQAADGFKIDQKQSPFAPESQYWHDFSCGRLVFGLLALAARSITCYQTSDNSTWLKKGGITPGISVLQALEEALHAWLTFAQQAQMLIKHSGRVRIDTWNCETGIIPHTKESMDVVLVSPPYANRLD